MPPDPNKLCISAKSFQAINEYHHVPAAFLFALSRYYLPSGHGCRVKEGTAAEGAFYGFWYFLPVRVQVECTDRNKGHASSTAGNNQIDPFHYLHLPDSGVDLRGSTVAICSQYSVQMGAATNIVINFMDGRWSRAAEEPQKRIAEVLSHYAKAPKNRPTCFMHAVYLSSVIR